MNYITATDLRTKSSELIDSLEKGVEVSLIHRSKVVAVIKPKRQPKPLSKSDIDDIQKLATQRNLPKMSYEDREKQYKKELTKKYGQDIS